MKITIHRGCNEIGGCITEYETNGWRLFVDYGEQLPGYEKKPVEIDRLNKGNLSKSILLISHYHHDHVGNIDELSENIPIFMGYLCKEILHEVSSHLSCVSDKEARIAERLEKVNTFKAGESFHFGDFKITPLSMDHSAFDAYGFKIEAQGLCVFHTGDFRTHGFRSSKLPEMLDRFVGKVDYVVCEATNISHSNEICKTEYELQKEYEEAFRNNKANIVYVSSTNIDRIFSLYHAALRAGRPFYVDPFQKKIMDLVTANDNLWSKASLYRYSHYQPKPLIYDTNGFLYDKKFEDFLNEKGYVLIARTSDRFDSLIDKMPGKKKRYLSMWDGYINPKKDVYNERLAKTVGDDFINLHTSGHTDIPSLLNFFEVLTPKAIIPIHTDNPVKFAELFSDKSTVLLLNDGKCFNASYS